MRKDDARLDEVAGGSPGIDRRTIAKGVAWSVPVVIVATAAPAAAASGGVTITASRSGGKITFSFTNQGTRPVAVEITLITPGSGWDYRGAKVTIPAGQVKTITMVDRAPNDQILTVSYSVDATGHTEAVVVSSSVNP